MLRVTRSATPLLTVLAGLACAALAAAVSGRGGERARIPVAFVPAIRLGVDPDPAKHTFGLVADVAIDESGRIAVLDGLENRIAVFTPDGRPLATFGGPGAGPGELTIPVAIAAGPRDRVFVLDRGNARINVYKPEGGRSHSIPLDFGGEDLCFAEGRLYVLGERGGLLVHELAPETGVVLRSFAPDPAARDPLMRSTRATGYLGCGDGEIVLFPLLLPEIRRYSVADGHLAEIDTIPGYRAVRAKRVGRSVVLEAPRGGRHHIGASLVSLGGQGWLIQTGFARRGARSLHEIESIRSYLLPPRGPLRQVAGPTFRLTASRGSIAVGTFTTPAPRVEVFHLRPAPGAER